MSSEASIDVVLEFRVHYDTGEFVRAGERRGSRVFVVRGEIGVVNRGKIRVRHCERSTVSNTSRGLGIVVVLSGSCSGLYRGCLEVSSLFLSVDRMHVKVVVCQSLWHCLYCVKMLPSFENACSGSHEASEIG